MLGSTECHLDDDEFTKRGYRSQVANCRKPGNFLPGELSFAIREELFNWGWRSSRDDCIDESPISMHTQYEFVTTLAVQTRFAAEGTHDQSR